MKRLDTHVPALDGALRQAPEVFEFVRVDRTINIRFRVIDHFVSVFRIEPIVGLQRIGVKCGAFRNRATTQLEDSASYVCQPPLCAPCRFRVQAIQTQSLCLPVRDRGFSPLPLSACMNRSLPPMNVSSASTVPVILLMVPWWTA